MCQCLDPIDLLFLSLSFLSLFFPYNVTVLLRCNFHSLKMYNSQYLGGQGKRSL